MNDPMPTPHDVHQIHVERLEIESIDVGREKELLDAQSRVIEPSDAQVHEVESNTARAQEIETNGVPAHAADTANVQAPAPSSSVSGSSHRSSGKPLSFSS